MAKVISSSPRFSLVEREILRKSFSQVVQENAAVIAGGIIGLILLSLGIFYWSYQKRLGLDELRLGIRTLQSGDASKAATQLQHIGRSYLGSTERALGLFYLGEAYVAQEQAVNAVSAYDEALTTSKDSKEKNPYLQQVILFKLGQAAEQRGDVPQARQRYEQAGAVEGPLKTEAIAAAARTAEKTNDLSAAAAYYEQLLAQSPDSPLVEVFQKRARK